MYIKTTYYAGDTVEVYKTVSYRYGKKIARQKGRINPTPEKMAELNEINAAANLRRLINTNFKQNDHHLVYKYPRGKAPDKETAKKHGELLLRRLRKLYKSYKTELKYIHVVEYKRTQIHHHLIINAMDSIPLKMLAAAWEWGGVNATPLYTEPDFKDLAWYLIKETRNSFRDKDAPSSRRWNQSRNLKKPKKVVEVIRASKWREAPQAPKGYMVETDSIVNKVSDSGLPYQFYRLYAVPEYERRPARKKRNQHRRAAQ